MYMCVRVIDFPSFSSIFLLDFGTVPLVGVLYFVFIYYFAYTETSRSDEVHSIQQYAIKFVSDIRQVGGFLRVLWFPPPIKLTATCTIYLKYC